MEFHFQLKGLTALLMHADDVEQADLLQEWRKNPQNKSLSVSGDDRSPSWTWMTYLYHDGKHLSIPSDNLMVSLRHAAAKIPHKKGSSFKALSQAGLLIRQEHLRFTTEGRQVALADLLELREEGFKVQAERVRDQGFRLYVKRASVNSSKHVRVRARFDRWEAAGSVEVLDPAITTDVLTQMFELAGRYAGLCDWRPSAPKSPGSFGLFESELVPANGKPRTKK